MPERQRKRVANIAGYTSERQTAEELGVALRTLRLWRWQGKGPPYVKLGGQVHYSNKSITAWLKSCEIQPVREEIAAA
jgi:predicted site-specific integrase-resolvase